MLVGKGCGLARPRIWGGIVAGVALVFRGWAQLNRFLDANVVDGGFDKGCEEIETSGGLLARVQSGRGQMYLAFWHWRWRCWPRS